MSLIGFNESGFAARELAWFCVRTHPNREEFAAANLNLLSQVESFLPQIQFQRKRNRKPVWVREALFPGYVFARFYWRESLRAVYFCNGVSQVVHFGHYWPNIEDGVIVELRNAVGATGVKAVEPPISPGEELEIATGPFVGLSGLVTRVIPARMRVQVLLDFLGQMTTVEIPFEDVRCARDVRAAMAF